MHKNRKLPLYGIIDRNENRSVNSVVSIQITQQ